MSLSRSVVPDRIVCLEDGRAFKMLKRHLRTIHGMSPAQRHEDEGLLTEIRTSIHDADDLVFLGFAFHPDNMQPLTLPDGYKIPGRHLIQVFATVKGVSESDRQVVASQVERLVQRPQRTVGLQLLNGSGNDLFYEYWRSLTQ